MPAFIISTRHRAHIDARGGSDAGTTPTTRTRQWHIRPARRTELLFDVLIGAGTKPSSRINGFAPIVGPTQSRAVDRHG